MNFIKNNPIIVVVGVGILLALAGITIYLSQIRTSPGAQDEAALGTSTITSPFTESQDTQAIAYGGSADPSRDGALPNLKIFGLSELPVPEFIRDGLEVNLTKVLTNEIPATFNSTFVQIDKSTLKCHKYDCSFNFYLDSPESYYSVRLFRNDAGGPEYTLRREPLPGGNQ